MTHGPNQAGHFACHSNKIFHSFIHSSGLYKVSCIRKHAEARGLGAWSPRKIILLEWVCHLRGCCGPKNANFPLVVVRISFWKAEFLISRRVRLNLANTRNKIHVLYLLYVCTLSLPILFIVPHAGLSSMNLEPWTLNIIGSLRNARLTSKTIQ